MWSLIAGIGYGRGELKKPKLPPKRITIEIQKSQKASKPDHSQSIVKHFLLDLLLFQQTSTGPPTPPQGPRNQEGGTRIREVLGRKIGWSPHSFLSASF